MPNHGTIDANVLPLQVEVEKVLERYQDIHFASDMVERQITTEIACLPQNNYCRVEMAIGESVQCKLSLDITVKTAQELQLQFAYNPDEELGVDNLLIRARVVGSAGIPLVVSAQCDSGRVVGSRDGLVLGHNIVVRRRLAPVAEGSHPLDNKGGVVYSLSVEKFAHGNDCGFGEGDCDIKCALTVDATIPEWTSKFHWNIFLARLGCIASCFRTNFVLASIYHTTFVLLARRDVLGLAWNIDRLPRLFPGNLLFCLLTQMLVSSQQPNPVHPLQVSATR